MKSSVEQQSATRVKITVEVPFDELKPEFDKAHEALSQQVQIPGFRKGKAPAKLIEARVGRGPILEQVLNEMVPSRYGQAVEEHDLKVIGQPEVDVTKLEDGDVVEFTAEVDVRPEIELPDFSDISVEVDALKADDEAVQSELDNLLARFGTLTGVERAVEDGDFISIDLSATVDGEELEEASTEGLSYQVGSGDLIDGLDEAVTGLAQGESKEFGTKLVAGDHEGEDAQVTVTVQSVKVRQLPDADDEFAQMASEFDTIAELREDLAKQATDRKTADQAVAARDALLDLLRDKIDFEVPEAVIDNEITQHLAAEGKEGDEEHAAEIRDDVTSGVRDQIILDVLAETLDVRVDQNELLDFLFQTAQQYGMEPGQFMQGAQQAGQIPAFVSELARNKSLALALRQVTVKDSAGKELDLSEFIGSDEADAAAIVDEVERIATPADADEKNGSAGSGSSPSSPSSASSASAPSAASAE